MTSNLLRTVVTTGGKFIALTAVGCTALTMSGCSSVLYGGFQNYAQSQCDRITDTNDYRRCRDENSTSQSKYEAERAKAK